MTATARLTMPPIACRHWCEYQDGHPGANFLEDQWCGSPTLEVQLSRHVPIRYTDETLRPDFVAVCAYQQPGDEVLIHVGHNESAAPEMTVSEAQQLVEALQLVIGQVTR